MPAEDAHRRDGCTTSTGSTTFENSMFELASEGSGEGIAAELHAARLRLEAAEGDRQGLAAELEGTQGRLHIALEVLEGVLAERSALLKQTHELQAQLAAALADQRQSRESLGARSSPAASSTFDSPEASATPRRQLRQELLLAQAQLADARQQQAALEGERQQLLREREEEEARLQEGLAQALSQASCAQREADTAAERAAHWCSLAQLLQRSALLPEGQDPSSPASLASLYSPAASSTAISSVAASRSCSRAGDGCGASGGGGGAPRQLVADYWSPGAQEQAPRQAAGAAGGCGGTEKPRAAGSVASGGAGGDRASLIAAFHAVATAPTEEEQLQGSPVLQRCQSPARPAPAAMQHGQQPRPRPPEAGLAASAHLAPGCHLQLLHKLPTPGMSFASSLGGCGSGGICDKGGGSGSGGHQSPTTPEPFSAGGCKVPGSPPAIGSLLSTASLEASEHYRSSTSASSSTAESLSLASSVTSLAAAAAPTPLCTPAGRPSGSKPAQLPPGPRSSFLRKLLCASGLPLAGAAHQQAA